MNTAADVKKRTAKNDFIEAMATIVFAHLVVNQLYMILKKKNAFLFSVIIIPLYLQTQRTRI